MIHSPQITQMATTTVRRSGDVIELVVSVEDGGEYVSRLTIMDADRLVCAILDAIGDAPLSDDKL